MKAKGKGLKAKGIKMAYKMPPYSIKVSHSFVIAMQGVRILATLIIFIGLNTPCYGGESGDSFGPWEFNNPVSEKKVIEPYSLTGRLLMQGIKIFSNYISPVDGDRCPMHPTCAAYSLQAIKKHGAFLGFIMTADRLIHESSEMDYAPIIKVGNRHRFYDPVSNNDFWWYNPSALQ